MKTLLALLLSVLLPLLTVAQAYKTKKKRSTYLFEEFQVRADNDTVREGTYRKSLLTNKALLEEGQYEANRRVGVWTFYGHTNQPELIYNYNTQQVISLTRTQRGHSVATIREGDSLVNVTLEDGPIYLASSQQVYGIMAQTVRFPPDLQRAGHTELTMKVLATVAPAGTFYRPICSVQDKAFLQTSKEAVTKAFNGVEWIPARYQQQPVTATYLFDEVVLIGYSVAR
jgi:hypothetical protein